MLVMVCNNRTSLFIAGDENWDRHSGRQFGKVNIKINIDTSYDTIVIFSMFR